MSLLDINSYTMCSKCLFSVQDDPVITLYFIHACERHEYVGESCVLNSKSGLPWLPFHKILILVPCCTVLPGGISVELSDMSIPVSVCCHCG